MDLARPRDPLNLNDQGIRRASWWAWHQRVDWALDALFAPRTESPVLFVAKVGWRATLLECSLVALAVLTFCSSFLDLGTQRVLTGNESEIFQSLDWTLMVSLKEYGQFPLWNPYIRTGIPFVADPFLHVLSPAVFVPVVALGVVDGFKVALFLSFLAAGLGMWWMGAVLGAGRFARLWMALMYAFTGQNVARFFQGEYDFVLNFGWIPWAIAGVIAALSTRRRLHVSVAAISLAMLFLGGHVYFPFYTLLAIAVYAPLALVQVRLRPRFAAIRWDTVKVLLAVGILAAGLVALQMLPMLEFWPHFGKATNLEMTDSQTLQQIWLDYTVPDKQRPDAIKWLPPEEFYAYTGTWPFLALVLLPLAIWKRDRRPLLFFALLFLVAVLWIDVRDTPWREIYVRYGWINQFRYPTRMLIFGAFAVTGLAGLCLDSLMKVLSPDSHPLRASVTAGASWRNVVALLGAGLLTAFMLWSVADVYQTNRGHVGTREYYPVPWQVLGWLRNADPAEYFVWLPGDWHAPAVANRLHFIDCFYGFSDIRPLSGMFNRRTVQAQPNYRVLGNDKVSTDPDAVVYQRFPTHTIYKLPHSLPFAFAVGNDKLLDPAGGRELQREEVSELTPFVSGPNGLELIVRGDVGSTLVVLIAQYPGWRVTVDGREQPLKNVGGFLATDLQPGIHKYEFSFTSTTFGAGIAISLLAVVVTLVLIASDVRFGLAGARRRAWSRLSHLFSVWRGRLWQTSTDPGPTTLARAGGKPIAVEAVYRAGVLKPAVPLDIPQNSRVRITVSAGRGLSPTAAFPVPVTWHRLGDFMAGILSRAISLPVVLFALGVLVYLVTRLWALDQFPGYFYYDEPWIALKGEDLWNQGFRDRDGLWLPVYFQWGPRWSPVLAAYAHAVSVGLFGKSIFVARATSALFSLFGAIAVGLMLRLVFRSRYWWAAIPFMAAIPIWFLHSRMAFETVISVSLLAWFLLFYLLYRTRSPSYLLAAIPCAVAAFYAYSNGEAVVGTLGLMLLLSDIRYHLRQRATLLLTAASMVAVSSLPLIGFLRNHSTGFGETLSALDSYWLTSASPLDKLMRYLQNYLYGLSPQYWFQPGDTDMLIHRMGGGYAPMPLWSLPLLMVGVWVCLRGARSSSHRAVLLAALAAPTGAALVGVAATRVMAFVVPATLLAVLGLEWLLVRLPHRLPYGLLAMVVFTLLSLSSISMLRQSLAEGSTWIRNYGQYGLQWGAREVFGTIREFLEKDPRTRVVITPNWAAGTDTFARFFLTSAQQQRVKLFTTVDNYLGAKGDLTPDTVLVMVPGEYLKAKASPVFKSVQVEKAIAYPDGSPAFYFARLAYADNADALMAADRDARRRLVESQVTVDGQTVRARHSRLDMGQPQAMFDGDPRSLVRGEEANPFVLELTFPRSRAVQGLTLDLNLLDVDVTVSVRGPGDSRPTTYMESFRGPVTRAELVFGGGPRWVEEMRIEIKNVRAGDTDHIHVYEVTLR